MMQAKSVSIECYKCKSCGNTILPVKSVCARCGGTEITLIEAEGKGKVIDFTIITFPPDNYKDLVPYTSVLVQLNNGCRVFGIIKGECKDIPSGSPVTMVEHDEARGAFFFQLDESVNFT